MASLGIVKYLRDFFLFQALSLIYLKTRGDQPNEALDLDS